MKKLVSALLAGIMCVGMTACSSGSGSTTATSTAPEATVSTTETEATGDMKIAMITDYGDITDQSFNQTTYEAAKSFADENSLEFTYYKPAGDSTAERVAMIDKAAADGYNVIVMPGYAFAEAIVEAAPMYPEVKFVALDVSEYDLTTAAGTDTWEQENVFSAVYQEELAGYMAGYAAVKMGYKELGFLGGMAVPAVIRYGSGFIQGADNAATELGLTDVNIKYVYGGQFFGDADIKAVMDTWYQGGTEVVFACGGGIYTSAAEAAGTTGKVIGVDVDQAATIDGAYGEGITITSAMKGLGATVNTLLTAIKDGEWDKFKGQIQNLGLDSGDDPTLNYVQLPMDTTVWTDTFTVEDYKQMVHDMYAGKIAVSNDISALPEVSSVTVDDQGAIKG